jgi:hypothetical protein
MSSLATTSQKPTSSGPAACSLGLSRPDFRQLDSFERFHPLTGIPFSQALLDAIYRLSFVESDLQLDLLAVASERTEIFR